MCAFVLEGECCGERKLSGTLVSFPQRNKSGGTICYLSVGLASVPALTCHKSHLTSVAVWEGRPYAFTFTSHRTGEGPCCHLVVALIQPTLSTLSQSYPWATQQFVIVEKKLNFITLWCAVIHIRILLWWPVYGHCAHYQAHVLQKPIWYKPNDVSTWITRQTDTAMLTSFLLLGMFLRPCLMFPLYCLILAKLSK